MEFGEAIKGEEIITGDTRKDVISKFHKRRDELQKKGLTATKGAITGSSTVQHKPDRKRFRLMSAY